jgi:hypothetical protein
MIVYSEMPENIITKINNYSHYNNITMGNEAIDLKLRGMLNWQTHITIMTIMCFILLPVGNSCRGV